MILALFSLAFAGKLQEGWRGIPYGPNTVLSVNPTADCTPYPEPIVRWACKEEIGGIPVEVSYLDDEGYFVGVIIHAQGYSACATVFSTLSAAWKVPFTVQRASSSALPDGFWNLSRYKTETSAMWSYNPYSGAGSASTMNDNLNALVKTRKAAKAAAAAESL